MEDTLFLTFQRFNDEALANDLIQVLKQNKIRYLVDTTGNFDPTFSNSESNKEFKIKLLQEDFERVNDLLLKIISEEIESVSSDYYLFEFSDEELIDIIIKADEWNRFDYLLAQKILKERGKEIHPDLVRGLRKQRISELAKPEQSSRAWLYSGYILAVMGGIIALIIGWHLMTNKKTLPTGDRVYGFTASDRTHGTRIFWLGLFFLAFWFIFKMRIYADQYFG
jgi:hypothetical protein